jgi:hypothetical protein
MVARSQHIDKVDPESLFPLVSDLNQPTVRAAESQSCDPGSQPIAGEMESPIGRQLLPVSTFGCRNPPSRGSGDPGRRTFSMAPTSGPVMPQSVLERLLPDDARRRDWPSRPVTDRTPGAAARPVNRKGPSGRPWSPGPAPVTTRAGPPAAISSGTGTDYPVAPVPAPCGVSEVDGKVRDVAGGGRQQDQLAIRKDARLTRPGRDPLGRWITGHVL